MRQRMYLSCELVPEAVERVSWLREQRLSWFERSGRSRSSRSPSKSAAERFPARAPNWSAYGGSARIRRARCWPSSMGKPNRSSM